MAPDSAPARSPAAPVAAPARRPPPPRPHPHPRAPAHTGPPVLDQRAGRAGPRVGRAPESSPRRGAAERAPDGADSLRGTVAPLLRTCSAPGTRTPCPCACVPRACGSGPWAHGDGRGAAPGKGPARPQARRASERRASEPRAPGSPPPRAAPEARRPLKTGCEGAHVPTDAPPRRRRQPPSPRPRRHLPSQLLQLLGAGRLRGPMVLLLPPDVLRPLVPAPCAPCLGASAAPAGLAGAADGSCPWAGRPSQLRPERPHGPCLGSSRLLAGRLLPAGLVTRPPQPSPPSPPCSRPPQRSQEVLPPVLGGLGARLSQPRSGAEPPPPPDPPDPGPQPAPSASSGSWGRSQEEPQWPGKRPAPVLGSLGVHLAVARKSLVGPWVVLCQAGKGTREGGQVHVPKPR